jgi:hypothetical protein
MDVESNTASALTRNGWQSKEQLVIDHNHGENHSNITMYRSCSPSTTHDAQLPAPQKAYIASKPAPEGFTRSPILEEVYVCAG